jgi:hypothetical protein
MGNTSQGSFPAPKSEQPVPAPKAPKSVPVVEPEDV